MNRGKDICKELKAVRKRIAEENDIVLEIPECTYNGPCKGTCPRCESEVRFLENELAKRIKLGKVAKVAGLALALGSSVNVSAQAVDSVGTQHAVPVEATQNQFRVKLTGVVQDSTLKEPIPFVNVIIKQDGKQVTGGTTDFDGIYSLMVVPGVYDMEISAVGYKRFVRTGVVVPEGKKRVELEDIILASTPAQFLDTGILIEGGGTPLIEPGSPGQDSNMEIDGVHLRIQY